MGNKATRGAGRLPRRIVYGALFVALCAGVVGLVMNVREYALPIVPIVRLWFAPQEQQRANLAPVPYEALIEADEMMPREARMLLVTDGTDVRHFEYTAFHRALYYLSPRSIYWMSPAPLDGTWEARFWISEPLEGDSIRALAAEKGADYVLALGGAAELEVGAKVGEWEGARLSRLSEVQPSSQPVTRAELANGWGAVGLIGALVSVLVFGFAIVNAAEAIGTAFNGVERWGLAWAVGAGVVSLVLAGLIGLGLPLAASVGVITVLAIATFAGSVVYRRRHQSERRKLVKEERDRDSQGRWVVVLLVVWVGLNAAFVAWMAMGQPLNFWDSWTIWGLKARSIFLEQQIAPIVSADPTHLATHPDYPLRVPLIEAWVYQWLGAPDDRLVGITALADYLALVGIGYGYVRRQGMTRAGACLAAAVLGSMAGLTLLAGQVYADVTLALYGLIAAAYLYEWVERGGRSALLVGALGAGLLPWTKREGWILLAAICVTLVIVHPRTRRVWMGIGAAVGAALVMGAPWAIYSAVEGLPNADFLPLTPTTFWANLGRAPTIASQLIRDSLSADWSFVLPLAALGLLILIVAQRPTRATLSDMPLVYFGLVACIYLGAMGLTYFFSAFTPYTSHLLSSGYRLVAQVTPLVVVGLALEARVRTIDDPSYGEIESYRV